MSALCWKVCVNFQNRVYPTILLQQVRLSGFCKHAWLTWMLHVEYLFVLTDIVVLKNRIGRVFL